MGVNLFCSHIVESTKYSNKIMNHFNDKFIAKIGINYIHAIYIYDPIEVFTTSLDKIIIIISLFQDIFLVLINYLLCLQALVLRLVFFCLSSGI